MYKKMVMCCIAVIILLNGNAIFANEMVKQKIIAFEQSVPWSGTSLI